MHAVPHTAIASNPNINYSRQAVSQQWTGHPNAATVTASSTQDRYSSMNGGSHNSGNYGSGGGYRYQAPPSYNTPSSYSAPTPYTSSFIPPPPSTASNPSSGYSYPTSTTYPTTNYDNNNIATSNYRVPYNNNDRLPHTYDSHKKLHFDNRGDNKRKRY